MPIPAPLFADFPAGFDRVNTGYEGWNPGLLLPAIDDQGNLGHLPLSNNFWQGSAYPEAIYPDGHSVSMGGTLSNFQLKMAMLSMLWQMYQKNLVPDLQRQPGTIQTGGQSGSWLVVPL